MPPNWETLRRCLDARSDDVVTITFDGLKALCGPFSPGYWTNAQNWGDNQPHAWAWSACSRTARLSQDDHWVSFAWVSPITLEPILPQNVSHHHVPGLEIEFENRGAVTRAQGRLATPRVRPGPGIYVFGATSPAGVRVYVGEGGHVPKRMSQYRSPQKATEQRVRAWLLDHLAGGPANAVSLHVVITARFTEQETPLDLVDQACRRLVENALIVDCRRNGVAVENL